MLDFLFNSLWGWLSVTGIVVIACAVVAWFIPSQRWAAIITAAGAIFASIIYWKGRRDNAALEKKRKEEAVRKARASYDKIDARPDTADDVARRMRDGSF